MVRYQQKYPRKKIIVKHKDIKKIRTKKIFKILKIKKLASVKNPELETIRDKNILDII